MEEYDGNEDTSNKAGSLWTYYIRYDADNLSGTIIDSYQRYLKRKRAIGQK